MLLLPLRRRGVGEAAVSVRVVSMAGQPGVGWYHELAMHRVGQVFRTGRLVRFELGRDGWRWGQVTG